MPQHVPALVRQSAQRRGAVAASLALLLSGGTGVAIPGVAVAAVVPGDVTPPALSVEPRARFLVGSEVSTFETEGYLLYNWMAHWRWSTWDESGICAQRVLDEDIYSSGDEDPYDVGADVRSYSRWISGYDEGKGYPYASTATVTVEDCAGNTTTGQPSEARLNETEDTSPSITYGGAWRTARFAGFLAGTTRYTSRRGASFVKTVDGGPVGLVMERASDRGSAAVFVDGKRVATVNTYSATKQHRRVVWERVLAPGQHTLKVVNLATAGHPRIDLDAILN